MLIRKTSFAFAMTVATLTVATLNLGNGQLVSAQQIPTTVQLPSISSFSYNGTVVVPDGGSAFLGGVKRASTGSSRRGLSRAFGADLSNTQASVHAQIIDNAEIDRQILGGTPKEFLRREQMKQAQGGGAIDPDAEGKSLVRYARREYKAGKQSAAFVGYQMAIETLASQRLRDLATVEFKRVFGTSAAQALRMSSTRRRF